MSLVEIVRFTDVHEADLAAAFLASRDIDVTVTERFQTTVDPLMQRALGIRLMGPASVVDEARSLLAKANAGEFASEEGDDIPPLDDRTRVVGSAMALAAFATGGFWGSSLPRRFRPVSWLGVLFALAILAVGAAIILGVANLILNPP